MGSLLFSILLTVCGIGSFWAAIIFLRKGEAHVMGGPFTRAGQPIRFWAYTIWLLLLGCLVLLLAAVPGSR
jgi:hypothetical protein